MKLYHTGFSKIENPDIKRGRKNADFGQGFYTSPDREFSARWAKMRRGETVYLNTYELGDAESLKIYELARGEEWFDYIFSNRRTVDKRPDADVVIGPVANDTLYDTFGILTSGYVDSTTALSILNEGPCYTQLVIKSERALERLRWICAEKLDPMDIEENRKVLLKEEAEYQEAIARIMGQED